MISSSFEKSPALPVTDTMSEQSTTTSSTEGDYGTSTRTKKIILNAFVEMCA
jgi:hypothetical protein